MSIKFYCPEYDSMYKSNTGEWTEEVCGDPDCEYCKNRPENHNECENCKL